MKNLKPSQLPVGTVIDDESEGVFIKQPYIDGLKREVSVWSAVDYDYMGPDRISDEGCVTTHDKGYFHLTSSKKSDDYFTDYKIVAVPPGFVFPDGAEGLHGPVVSGGVEYLDGTSIFHACEGYNCEEL
jgi:hypothetical protein